MQSRREERHKLKLVCRVRTSPRRARRVMIQPQRAAVTDLSILGCAIHSPRMALSRSDQILVRIGEGEAIPAEVKWTRRGVAAGIQFSRPLRPSDLDGFGDAHGVAAVKWPIRMQGLNSALRSAC